MIFFLVSSKFESDEALVQEPELSKKTDNMIGKQIHTPPLMLLVGCCWFFPWSATETSAAPLTDIL